MIETIPCELIDGPTKGRIWRVEARVQKIQIPVWGGGALVYKRIGTSSEGVALFSCEWDTVGKGPLS